MQGLLFAAFASSFGAHLNCVYKQRSDIKIFIGEFKHINLDPKDDLVLK